MKSISIFEEGTTAEETPVSTTESVVVGKVFDGPGRGRKQCPSCEIYIGVRSKNCPSCDHSFERRRQVAVKPKDEAKGPTVKRTRKTRVGKEPSVETHTEDGRPFSIVITPAGKCPVELKGVDENSVSEWSEGLRKFGASRCELYTPDAMKYYVRSFYSVFSEEYKTVCEILDRQVEYEA